MFQQDVRRLEHNSLSIGFAVFLFSFSSTASAEFFPGFSEWISTISGNYFDSELNPPASNWDTGAPPVPGDIVYINIGNDICGVVNPGCERIRIDLYAPDPEADPPGSQPLFTDVVQSSFEFGAGDYILDLQGRDLVISGFNDPNPGEFDESFPGTLYVGTTPEMTARVEVVPAYPNTSIRSEQGIIGADPQAFGHVILTEGTWWQNSADLWVGYSGMGYLDIDDGATVTTDILNIGGGMDDGGFGFEVGHGSVLVGESSLEAGDSAASLNARDIFVGGYNGDATLDILKGSAVTVTNSISVSGNLIGDTRHINVYGDLTVFNALYGLNYSEVNLRGGNIFTSELLFDNSTALNISSGRIEVIGGRFVPPNTSHFDLDSLTNFEDYTAGTVLVLKDGAYAPTPFNSFDIGRNGFATLEISDGSSLTTGFTRIASEDIASVGQVSVYGPGSLWSAGFVGVGDSSSAQSRSQSQGGIAGVVISDEARADFQSLNIGFQLFKPGGGAPNVVNPSLFQISDEAVVSTGFLTNRGLINVFSHAELRVDVAANEGLIVLNDGYLVTSLGFTNMPVFGIPDSGTIRSEANSANVISGAFEGENQSDVIVEANSELDFQDGDVRFETFAKVLVDGETWFHDPLSVVGGFEIDGGGQVSILDNLEIENGSFSFFSIEPELHLGPNAVINIDIAGTHFSLYEEVFVDNLAYLDGTLVLDLIGFSPGAGDTFDIFLAETLVDDFDSVVLPDIGPALFWEIALVTDGVARGLPGEEVFYDVVRASVLRFADPVPVPPALWLFGSALLVVSTRRVNRTHRLHTV